MTAAEQINMDSEKMNIDDVAIALKTRKMQKFRGATVIRTAFRGSFTLPGIIFLSRKYADRDLLLHEYGHVLQARKYGFFKYLFRIAVPSVWNYWTGRAQKKFKCSYYELPWEKEASELGGSRYLH